MTRNLASASFPQSRSARWLAVLGLGAVVLFAGAASAQDPNSVVAKINGIEIRQSDLALAEEELGPNLPQMDDAMKRSNLIDYIIDMKLIAKVADEKKLGDSEDFKRRLGFARERLLMDREMSALGKAAVTDEAMRKVYEEAAKQIESDVEVHARHILVEKEDEAKQIIADLKKGGNFAEIAKAKSKDPGAADGGDLGFFTKEQMVPEFSAVAFKLEPGQISDPVKTQFGWHVIKVDEKRNRKAPEFDKVKGQIETFVMRKAQAEYVTKLREGAKIERVEAKPADKPAAPAPAKK
jgi:peptidyl-prolyl cis-trans isomerase C